MKKNWIQQLIDIFEYQIYIEVCKYFELWPEAHGNYPAPLDDIIEELRQVKNNEEVICD